MAKAFRRTSLNGAVPADAVIGEELEYPADLWQVGIGGDPEVVDLFLCGGPGIVAMPPDMVNQALDQVVVQFLVAVLDEAKKINIDDGLDSSAGACRRNNNPRAMRSI